MAEKDKVYDPPAHCDTDSDCEKNNNRDWEKSSPLSSPNSIDEIFIYNDLGTHKHGPQANKPCAAPGCSNEVSEDTKPSKAWKCSKQVPRASNWAERHTFCDTCIAKAAKKKNCPSCGALPR